MAAVWVKELTGSDSAAAFVLVCFGAPAVLAPVIGQVVDRFSRRRVLVLAHVGTAAAVGSLLLVTSADALWLVYVVIFVYGPVGYVTSAAQSGLLRDLLPDVHLAPANGALSALDQALWLASPLIGTGVYAIWGPVPVIVLTVVCFTVAALLLQTVGVTESAPETAEERGSYWHEISAGFRHLAATPGLGRLTLLLAIAIGATGLVNISMFPVMEQGLQVPPATLGLLVAPQGIGGLLAGLTVARLIARLGETKTFALGLVLLWLRNTAPHRLQPHGRDGRGRRCWPRSHLDSHRLYHPAPTPHASTPAGTDQRRDQHRDQPAPDRSVRRRRRSAPPRLPSHARRNHPHHRGQRSHGRGRDEVKRSGRNEPQPPQSNMTAAQQPA